MTRIMIRTAEAASAVGAPPWLSGIDGVRSYCSDAKAPIHLDTLHPDAGAAFAIAGGDADRLAYVWDGEVDAGGVRLRKGSSLIVERGGRVELTARAVDTRLVVFSTNRPATGREGDKVHLLPVEQVPRIGSDGAGPTSGALHANGKCPTCSVWLNENSLAGQAERPAPGEAIRGIHAHPEDEIIFVTEGRMRLGAKLFERGAALLIAADTLYGFAPGPEGVSFITFRPSGTTKIRFASGGDYKPSTFFDPIETIPYLAA